LKNIVLLIIFTFSFGIIGCVTFSTANSGIWLEYEIPPSRINNSGRTIMDGNLSDGSKFYVFYDEEIDRDSRHYYVILYQDFGWRLNSGVWSAPQNARERKRGHIYVNPKRRVAVYFDPAGDYAAFKVKIEN